MEITQDQLREIIKKYAKEIQKVVSEGTVGDYTWEGLLLYFQQEIEGANRPTQGYDRLPQGGMDERPEPETDPRLQKLLDQTQFGDILTITSCRGNHLASISGPVLSDQNCDLRVGIDLLDGEPYIVRDKAGIVWAPITYATLCRDGRYIAWV